MEMETEGEDREMDGTEWKGGGNREVNEWQV